MNTIRARKRAIRLSVVGLCLVAVVVGGFVLLKTGSRACSKVGCASAVSVDVGDVAGLADARLVHVHLCINDGQCADVTRDGRDLWATPGTATNPGTLLSVPFPGVIDDVAVQQLQITTESGDMLLDAHSDVSVATTKHYPNGESCDPICWAAAFIRDPSGMLIASASLPPSIK